MGTRTAAWLAWSLAALSEIMFVAAIALHVLARSMDSAGEWSTLGASEGCWASCPSSLFPW